MVTWHHLLRGWETQFPGKDTVRAGRELSYWDWFLPDPLHHVRTLFHCLLSCSVHVPSTSLFPVWIHNFMRVCVDIDFFLLVRSTEVVFVMITLQGGTFSDSCGEWKTERPHHRQSLSVEFIEGRVMGRWQKDREWAASSEERQEDKSRSR